MESNLKSVNEVNFVFMIASGGDSKRPNTPLFYAGNLKRKF